MDEIEMLQQLGDQLDATDEDESRQRVRQALAREIDRLGRSHFDRRRPRRRMIVLVAAVLTVLSLGGIAAAGGFSGGVADSPPRVVSADYTVGGKPVDLISVSYVPNGFERSEDVVHTYDSGAQMHSQLYSGDSSSFEIVAIRRPEPLDRGSDLSFPTDVANISLGGHDALLITASDGTDEVAVVEWQNGPAIVKVIGNHISVSELLKIAAGVSVSSAGN